jgi:hypothetical protein
MSLKRNVATDQNPPFSREFAGLITATAAISTATAAAVPATAVPAASAVRTTPSPEAPDESDENVWLLNQEKMFQPSPPELPESYLAPGAAVLPPVHQQVANQRRAADRRQKCRHSADHDTLLVRSRTRILSRQTDRFPRIGRQIRQSRSLII